MSLFMIFESQLLYMYISWMIKDAGIEALD